MMKAFTSKQVWKVLIKFQLTKSNPKRTNRSLYVNIFNPERTFLTTYLSRLVHVVITKINLLMLYCFETKIFEAGICIIVSMKLVQTKDCFEMNVPLQMTLVRPFWPFFSPYVCSSFTKLRHWGSFWGA